MKLMWNKSWIYYKNILLCKTIDGVIKQKTMNKTLKDKKFLMNIDVLS